MTEGSETGAARAGLVVAITPPTAGGAAVARDPLLERVAGLGESLGAATAQLTWKPGSEADLDGLVGALLDDLRESGATVVVLPDDDLGRQLAPLLALGLATSAVVDCSAIFVQGGAVVYVKPVQGDWLEREFSFADGFVQVATVRFDTTPARSTPADDGSQGRRVRAVAPRADGGPTPVRRIEVLAPDPRTVDLTHARRIVGVGAGAASEALLAAVDELAELLRSSLGATRPVVDDGRLPKERLIGQTGRAVAPDLYLALGVSGSPHHVAGVQGAEHILSVNHDERAAIVSLADASYVGELEEVLPALVRRLRAVQAGRTSVEGEGV